MRNYSIEQRQQSERVTEQASIVDLRLRSIKGDLITPTPQTPLTLAEYEVSPIMVKLQQDAVLYHVTYDLLVNSANRRRTCEVQVTMSAMFSLASEEFSESELQAFGYMGVIDILHPYVREIVHTLTGRMGIPPLVLDVKKPIVAM